MESKFSLNFVNVPWLSFRNTLLSSALHWMEIIEKSWYV